MFVHPSSIDLSSRTLRFLTGQLAVRPQAIGTRWRRLPPAGLLQVLCEADTEHVLLDGTLAECDRVGDSRADFSQKHGRHGMNVQVVADPAGRMLWISSALPGRTHDLTAARTTALSGSANARVFQSLLTAPTSAPAPG